ncbi:MAG TPA: biosynthetic arginine decarboxylase [Longimicrobiales bacterium]|nr:biosynthetic arginine decarboxylase [Longimicrobiales bacterium]
MAWTARDALELYNVEGWGAGFFGVNEAGHVSVHPTRDPAVAIDLYELATDLIGQGVRLPLLLRFPDILHERIEALTERFEIARREFGYEGPYTPVYPIKVNQQRRVIREIVAAGEDHGVGLEVGSKPELLAVIALTEGAEHLIVCNGYKDEEYIRLALMGQRLGHEVLIVLEKVQEADTLLAIAGDMGVEPRAGVRIKLASEGAGRWSESAGAKSKFGLGAAELMAVIDRFRAAGLERSLRMIHFHLGSQIPDIRNIKQGMAEVARFYVELRRLGIPIDTVDVGGGLGVDYDGSRSTSPASVNYSLQEYANDVVYVMAEACRVEGVPMPHLISESGRALTAHHALLLVNVIERESHATDDPGAPPDDAPRQVFDLAEAAGEIDRRGVREVYHDLLFARSELRTLFNAGVISLAVRALGERHFLAAMRALAAHARRDPEEFEDILPTIEEALTDRYFCNFSLFQSLPDSWAIDQLFPILPIHRLDEEPTRRGTLQDVTCDSDGKIDAFVGQPEGGLPLHDFRPGTPYVLGIFLAGAYQEILGDLHNLFGDTDSVHVRVVGDDYEVEDVVRGDTMTDVLRYVAFDPAELVATFRRKVKNADLAKHEANGFIADYIAGLAGYTYLTARID